MTDHLQIEIERAFYDEENKRIDLYRDYARGKQPSTLTPAQAVLLAGVNSQERADNICHQIIAEAADRLELLGFDVDDDAVQSFLDTIYIKNALPDLSGEVHYNTARDGNAALLVEFIPNGKAPDYGRIVLSLDAWWDGVQGVFISPGGEGKEPYAVRDRIVAYAPNNRETTVPVFFDNQRRPVTASGPSQIHIRRFVYYDNRIEKWERPQEYQTVPGTQISQELWQPYFDPMDAPETKYLDGQRNVLAWEKPDGSPLHIPYVHFANAGRMFGIQGVGELSGGVLNFQDEINECQADLTAATRLTAFQIIWIKGYTASLDDLGNPVKPKISFEPGSFLYDTSESFEADAIPAGSVSEIIKSLESKKLSAATSTRTPRHSITGGDWPSGDALERAERPSRSKGKRQAAKHGLSWSSVMHKSVEQSNAFGKANLDEDALILPIWGPFSEASANSGAAGEAGADGETNQNETIQKDESV